MGCLDHAKRELRAAGYPVREGEDKLAEVLAGEEDMNVMMADNVMELLEVFANQGHSGFSAPYAISLFTTLAKQEPLGPLTGEDSEWNDVSEMCGNNPQWQNNRCSHVFKDETHAWDIDGKVFIEPGGGSYTNSDSFVNVEFPYVPKRINVQVDEDGNELVDAH